MSQDDFSHLSPSHFSLERKELEDRLGEIRSKMSQTQEEKDKRRHEQFEELEREIDSITGGPITNPSLSQSTSVTQFDGYKFGSMQ